MMRTRRSILAAGLALGTAAAFGNGTSLAAPARKSIVIYFTRTGRVETIAKQVASETGSGILRLELVSPYAENYSDMTYIARSERSSGARREISTPIPDLTPYDTVFVGSPYWWGGLSIPMRTFLTDHPLEGKRLVPFCVSASSSPEGLWEDIRRICPRAEILKGFHSVRDSVPGSAAAVSRWLKDLGLTA